MKHEKTYVASTQSMGDGLFAKVPIKRGETIFVVSGRPVRMDIRDARDSALFPRAIGLGEGLWLDPRRSSPLWYLNHSCSPNAGIRGAREVVALRDIQPGEQVTLDYAITEADLLWEMGCACGSPRCRQVIRSIQSLPIETFCAYLPYIPRYFQEVYDGWHAAQRRAAG